APRKRIFVIGSMQTLSMSMRGGDTSTDDATWRKLGTAAASGRADEGAGDGLGEAITPGLGPDAGGASLGAGASEEASAAAGANAAVVVIGSAEGWSAGAPGAVLAGGTGRVLFTGAGGSASGWAPAAGCLVEGVASGGVAGRAG